ncbi:MBL fold metallo-hydrolase [Corynebacterium choanae]|uniref:Lipoprotein n=1 Tax=Corynebacterium choanae TaxID=1862358 RepID=A0A3G6J929_9CORY|nr:MBL fold metallo-hydrolase [Corynebacterium choanae]AZA13388.1 hypothetical protein CCHOA_04900 [Corynebacterium choanae]
MTFVSTNCRHRWGRQLTVAAVASLLLAGCATTEEESTRAQSSTTSTETSQAASPREAAKAANRAIKAAPRFQPTPEVLPDRDYSGIDASAALFETSETVIISGPSVPEQLRAASLAVPSHAPMLRFTGVNAAAINQEIARLKASTVLIVGNAPDPTGTELTILRDTGTFKAVGELTALEFHRHEVGTLEQAVRAVAALDPADPQLLQAGFAAMPVFTNQPGVESQVDAAVSPQGRAAITGNNGSAPARANDTVDFSEVTLDAFPAQSATDGGVAPVIVASPASGIPALATIRAYGADIRMMDYHDPRINEATLLQVIGLQEAPVLAVGQQFGTGQSFAQSIDLAEATDYSLPGGRALVLPGQRMIAYYGHPSGPALGVMGEYPPAEAVAHLQELTAQYQPFSAEPVVPAFEIIATVASAGPGDGDYSNETDPAELIPYIDAITAAGGYAVLDLQPGRASLLEQAKRYESLLLRPNVSLALDPEWKLGPDEVPLTQVGHVDAAEINDVSQWLAQLTREHHLPQKMLVLHQFQLQMIRNREQLDLDHPELAFVLHADGHGVPAEKFATFDALLTDLDPRIFIAWKNFIDEDTPTFTPQETFAIEPKPYFVSYQ